MVSSNSTRDYVAAAYVSIFTSTPVSRIRDRAIALTELAPTGGDIAAVLEKKNGTSPEIFTHSLEKVEQEIEDGLRDGSLFTLSWYCRKIWGTGQQNRMIGKDAWEVEGYTKTSLDDLISGGKLGPYREMPPQVREYFDKSF